MYTAGAQATTTAEEADLEAKRTEVEQALHAARRAVGEAQTAP